MALKSYKPYTPGLRQKTVLLNEELTAKKPEKPYFCQTQRRRTQESLQNHRFQERQVRSPRNCQDN